MRVAELDRQGTENPIRNFPKFNNASYNIRYS